MLIRLNKLLDGMANYFAHRKGLLPMVGVGIIGINLILQFIPGAGWWAETDLLLHLGIILAIFGFLLAWAL